MKLVVGLGNPESKYNWTRHNTGFLVLDYYFKLKGLSWKTKPHLNAIWGKDGDTIFIKPQGYYNNSGRAVSAYMDYYKLSENDILVICDDFNLEFGKVRYRMSGRAAGNNGLKSIIAELGHYEFPRVRVGTGNDELRARLGDTDFVLSAWTSEEKELLPGVLAVVVEKINHLIG